VGEAGDGEAVGVSDGVGGAAEAGLGSTAVGLGDIGAVLAHATTTSPANSRIARRDFERTVTPI